MSAKTTPKAQDREPGATGGTDQPRPTATPEAQEQEFPSVPNASVFAWRDEHGGAILSQRALARIMIAMESIDTLTAILYQREIDTDCDGPGRLVFGSQVATGITSAIACCAELVNTILKPSCFDAVKAGNGTPEARHMFDLAAKVNAQQRWG